MNTKFKEENLYFLKKEDSKYQGDIDSIITDVNELNKFKDTNIYFDNQISIGQIKEQIESIISKEITLGESSKDAMKEWDLTEDQLLKKSYSQVSLHFDFAIFKDVIILTGSEIINQIEIINM